MKLINILKHEISSRMITCKGLTGQGDLDLRLERDGCAVMENFISKDTCVDLIERAKQVIKENKNSVRLESNGSDTRIYGVNKIEDAYELKSETEILDIWAKKFYKTERLKYFQMLGHISYKEGNLGSGSGWHRDSPFSHQFKFILYLNDVDESNGPFQYMLGTHREDEIYRYTKLLKADLSKYRFSENDVESILMKMPDVRMANVTGKAGTLLIADVKGLHRGKPLERGERWATTRYYFDKKIPSHLMSV